VSHEAAEGGSVGAGNGGPPIMISANGVILCEECSIAGGIRGQWDGDGECELCGCGEEG